MKTLTLPQMPDCWDSCGACSGDELLVAGLLVEEGGELYRGEPFIEIETDKTVMEIPAPCSGQVAEVLVKVGDALTEETVILTLHDSASAV